MASRRMRVEPPFFGSDYVEEHLTLSKRKVVVRLKRWGPCSAVGRTPECRQTGELPQRWSCAAAKRSERYIRTISEAGDERTQRIPISRVFGIIQTVQLC